MTMDEAVTQSARAVLADAIYWLRYDAEYFVQTMHLLPEDHTPELFAAISLLREKMGEVG